MKLKKLFKKMNGFVAREYLYRELSWSHNKVPYALISISGYFEQVVLRAGFWIETKYYLFLFVT